jgi:DNA-binding beta-propeller fold protein YncE
LTSPGALAQEAEKAIAFEAAVKMPVRGDAFRQPRAVHADIHTGETYVCDTFRNRIVIFDQEGFFRFEIAGGSIFRAPTDVAVDPEGYILSLAVRHGSRRIVALDFDGKLVGEISFSGLPADWAAPDLVSIALSPSGDRLYALDREHQSLLAADRSGQVVSIVDLAADLDPDDAREQILGHVDTYGRTVLVTIPTAGRVFLYDLDLEPQGTVGIKGTSPCYVGFPVAAALDSAGKVVILDKQRALMSRWDPETNRCLREYSGFGNAPGALYQPDDMALNDSGSLFVSQGFEGRVQVFRSLTSAPPQIEELSLSSQTEAVAGSEIGTLSFAALQRLEMLEQASDARLAEADALDDQQTALRTELEGAKEALQELQENHAVVMNVLKTELDEARSQQAKNEAILESLMAEVATLSSESSSVLGGIEGLEVRQREQQGTAAAVRSEVDGFRAEAVEELSRLEDAQRSRQVS